MNQTIPLSGADPPLGAEILVEIGRILIRWSRTENLLDHDIRELANLAGDAAKVNGLVSFKLRLTAWRALNLKLYPTSTEFLEWTAAIARQAKNVGKTRNTLIHGLWGGAGSDGSFMLVDLSPTRKGVKPAQHQFDINRLRSVSLQIAQLNESLHGYMVCRQSQGPSPAP